MGVSVGRGGELAAMRCEEEERLGDDGDGGTLLGPPGQLLGGDGYASYLVFRLRRWANEEIGERGSGHSLGLLNSKPERSRWGEGRMQPGTNPVA